MEAGFSVNAKDDDGNPFLFRAIVMWVDAFFSSDMADSKSIVQILVDAGADVNAKDGVFGNPLLLAAFFGDSADVVQILVDAGADVHARSADGNTLLYEAIALGNDAFFFGDEERYRAIVQILLDTGADVNARDSEGNPVLYKAFFWDADVVRSLVDAGADVNARDSEGNPVLYKAFFWDADVVRSLVDAGADVNTTIADGNTLLSEAVRLASSAFFSSDKERYERIVTILVDAGARQ